MTPPYKPQFIGSEVSSKLWSIQLYDITPSNATQEYPFLEAQLSEEDYADLVELQGRGQFDQPKPDT
jgi:hypothetical protein